jgi:hypothetical protein
MDELTEAEPTPIIDPAGSLAVEKTHYFFQEHPVILLVIISVTLGSPLLGLMIGSWKGGMLGLVLSVSFAAIGIQAVTKVRAERRDAA